MLTVSSNDIVLFCVLSLFSKKTNGILCKDKSLKTYSYHYVLNCAIVNADVRTKLDRWKKQYIDYLCTMLHNKINETNATIQYTKYGEDGKTQELHAIITIINSRLSYTEQLNEVVRALSRLVVEERSYVPVMGRLLLSDAANQAQAAMDILSQMTNCALSYVQQPPLNGTKIALWVYMQSNVSVVKVDANTAYVERNGMRHLYYASIVNPLADTYQETTAQLEKLEQSLLRQGLNIADNCVRTWFFVQNVDVNYSAVVEARKANFLQNGLTSQTHYIASTGIAGRHADKRVTSILDAYCIGGLAMGQMQYLYAADNMNRTIDYGVTFERATTIDYADRRHIIISGTASIDNKGAVVHEGDIVKQTLRMLDNVEALLKEGEATFDDMAHVIVYLRDTADYDVVEEILCERLKNIPYVITLAPVCRPGWLIEMEGMAISKRVSTFGDF